MHDRRRFRLRIDLILEQRALNLKLRSKTNIGMWRRSHAMLFPQLSQKAMDALAIFRRKKRTVRIELPIELDEVRKFFFQKRNEYGSRARLEKQRPGED